MLEIHHMNINISHKNIFLAYRPLFVKPVTGSIILFFFAEYTMQLWNNLD